MSINIETKHNSILFTTQILLAESDPVEVSKIIEIVDLEFQEKIKVVKSYDEILESIAKEKPRLLILGRIDKFNYFETCKGCHNILPDLPIFLLSRQEIINDSFLKLAKTRGLADIISLDSIRLNQLFKISDKSPDSQSINRTTEQLVIRGDSPVENRSTITGITGRAILGCLGEIVIISNNYFGPLAQGNYWRKAHVSTVGKFPYILNWSADHFSKISCNDNILESELTEEDIQGLQIWIQFFICECERIIVDFGDILKNSDLSLLTKDLLNKS